MIIRFISLCKKKCGFSTNFSGRILNLWELMLFMINQKHVLCIHRKYSICSIKIIENSGYFNESKKIVLKKGKKIGFKEYLRNYYIAQEHEKTNLFIYLLKAYIKDLNTKNKDEYE